jgi:hypothetical protein
MVVVLLAAKPMRTRVSLPEPSAETAGFAPKENKVETKEQTTIVCFSFLTTPPFRQFESSLRSQIRMYRMF